MLATADQFNTGDDGLPIVKATFDEKTKQITGVPGNSPISIFQVGCIVPGSQMNREQAIKDADGPSIVLVDCGGFIQIHDASYRRK